MLSNIYIEVTTYLSTLKGREGTFSVQYLFSDRVTLNSRYHAHIHVKTLPGDNAPTGNLYHVVNGFGDQPEVAINKALSTLKLILAPKDDDLFS